MLRLIFRSFITLLCLACLTLWVRSYWVSEVFADQKTTQAGLTFTRNDCTLASGEGGVYFNHGKTTWTVPDQVTADSHKPLLAQVALTRTDLKPGYAGNFDPDKTPLKFGFGHLSN